MAKKKTTATATHIELDNSFLDLTVDEQLSAVESILRGMSPNEAVRRSAKKLWKRS